MDQAEAVGQRFLELTRSVREAKAISAALDREWDKARDACTAGHRTVEAALSALAEFVQSHK